MNTPRNLEEGKPIGKMELETEATSEDSLKYKIKITSMQDKLNIFSLYQQGLICKQYSSEYDLKSLLANQSFSFKNIEEYCLFLQDILDNNKTLKIENKIKNSEDGIILIIPAKLGIIKEIKYEIKEKEITAREMQDNIMKFVNQIHLENEELKKKINDLQLEKEELKNKLEENKKQLEKNSVKKYERVKNLFKDSDIIKLDEKKMINDWIDPYNEKNITTELLFRTKVDGDSVSNFHNKCNGKGATITFIKTTGGKRIGGFTMIPWTSLGNYKKDPDAFIFSLDCCQKFVQWRNFDNSIYDHSSYGPTFGNGHDLYICNGCKSNTSSYCNSNYSYGFYNSYNLIHTGNQQTTFQVADYEVYLVKINK